MPTDPSKYPFELAAILADRLRNAKQELVTQWLERITERVNIETRRIFPTHQLLNHIPLLIEGVAGYLKRPERDIDSKAPVVAKAMARAVRWHQHQRVAWLQESDNACRLEHPGRRPDQEWCRR